MSNTCDFQFTSEDWIDRKNPREITADSISPPIEWECHHETYKNESRCIFHLDISKRESLGVESEEVVDCLIECIDDEEVKNEFIGAKFRDVKLDYQKIISPNNKPIDFSFSEFLGNFDISHGTISACRFDFSRFYEEVNFYGTKFLDNAWLMHCKFNDKLTLHLCNFQGSINNFNYTIFEGRVWGGVRVDQSIGFQDTIFKGRASFNNSTIGRNMVFDRAEFKRDLYIKYAKVNDLSIVPDSANPAIVVYLNRSEIDGGQFIGPKEGHITFDLTKSHLGNVTFFKRDSDDGIFRNFFFRDTTFSGFNFIRYRDELEHEEWRIHSCTPVNLQNVRLSDRDIEMIYNKAKNGANKIGDVKTASEFFLREMRQRRKVYKNNMREESVFKKIKRKEIPKEYLANLAKYVSNYLFDISSGYGERPSKVILISVTTILFFTGLLSIFQNHGMFSSFTTSFQAFVTLVFGVQGDVDPVVRLITAIEGFMGAFLIALFVFSLTRSVER